MQNTLLRTLRKPISRLSPRCCIYCSAPLLRSKPALPTRLRPVQAVRYTSTQSIQASTSNIPPPSQQSELVLDPSCTSRLDAIRKQEGNPAVVLRITVESGGCHGYQYKLDLEDMPDRLEPNEDGEVDILVKKEGTPYIIIDPISLDLTKGATIMFSTELIGSTFQIHNNPQAHGGSKCGCGVSFSLGD